jgi:hypothetical protein
VAKKEIAVKKYVVKLSAEERGRLGAPSHAGKSSARMLTRARILLKADVSEAGEGWSDSAISAALDTSVNNVARTRQQLVEEGFEATLSRKFNPNSARPRIFDGAAEAKLIALACSPPPEGFARWTPASARRESRRIEHRREGERQYDRTDVKKNRVGPGQSEHAYPNLALRRLPRPRSASPRQPVRMALHAKAWKLARHGRVQTRLSDHPVPEPPHPRQDDPRQRSRGWETYRNKRHAKADWQFTTENARVKLKRLYPQFE